MVLAHNTLTKNQLRQQMSSSKTTASQKLVRQSDQHVISILKSLRESHENSSLFHRNLFVWSAFSLVILLMIMSVLRMQSIHIFLACTLLVMITFYFYNRERKYLDAIDSWYLESVRDEDKNGSNGKSRAKKLVSKNKR